MRNERRRGEMREREGGGEDEEENEERRGEVRKRKGGGGREQEEVR